MCHGAPTRTVIGFLNCTIRQNLPSRLSLRGLVYTGYKKFHGMKFFKPLLSPNGNDRTSGMGPLSGPRRTTWVVLSRESPSLSSMHQTCDPGLVQPEGDPLERHYFQLYGEILFMGVSCHAGGALVARVLGSQQSVLWKHEHGWGPTSPLEAMRLGLCSRSGHFCKLLLEATRFLGTACGLWYCCCSAPH